MAKYRRKAVIIEAYQWSPPAAAIYPRWLIQAFNRPGFEVGAAKIMSDNTLHILGERSRLIATPGDFIIKGPKGEIYPCKAEVFHLMHDEVE